MEEEIYLARTKYGKFQPEETPLNKIPMDYLIWCLDNWDRDNHYFASDYAKIADEIVRRKAARV